LYSDAIQQLKVLKASLDEAEQVSVGIGEQLETARLSILHHHQDIKLVLNSLTGGGSDLKRSKATDAPAPIIPDDLVQEPVTLCTLPGPAHDTIAGILDTANNLKMGVLCKTLKANPSYRGAIKVLQLSPREKNHEIDRNHTWWREYQALTRVMDSTVIQHLIVDVSLLYPAMRAKTGPLTIETLHIQEPYRWVANADDFEIGQLREMEHAMRTGRLPSLKRLYYDLTIDNSFIILESLMDPQVCPQLNTMVIHSPLSHLSLTRALTVRWANDENKDIVQPLQYLDFNFPNVEEMDDHGEWLEPWGIILERAWSSLEVLKICNMPNSFMMPLTSAIQRRCLPNLKEIELTGTLDDEVPVVYNDILVALGSDAVPDLTKVGLFLGDIYPFQSHIDLKVLSINLFKKVRELNLPQGDTFDVTVRDVFVFAAATVWGDRLPRFAIDSSKVIIQVITQRVLTHLRRLELAYISPSQIEELGTALQQNPICAGTMQDILIYDVMGGTVCVDMLSNGLMCCTSLRELYMITESKSMVIMDDDGYNHHTTFSTSLKIYDGIGFTNLKTMVCDDATAAQVDELVHVMSQLKDSLQKVDIGVIDFETLASIADPLWYCGNLESITLKLLDTRSGYIGKFALSTNKAAFKVLNITGVTCTEGLHIDNFRYMVPVISNMSPSLDQMDVILKGDLDTCLETVFESVRGAEHLWSFRVDLPDMNHSVVATVMDGGLLDCKRMYLHSDVGDAVMKAYFQAGGGEYLQTLDFTATGILPENNHIDSLWQMLLEGNASNLQSLNLINAGTSKKGLKKMMQVVKGNALCSLNLDCLCIDIQEMSPQHLATFLSAFKKSNIKSLRMNNLHQGHVGVLIKALESGIQQIRSLTVSIMDGNSNELSKAWNKSRAKNKVPSDAILIVSILE
jgi:hypothetical protein